RGVFFGGLIGMFLYLLAPEAGPGQILTSMLLGLAVWLIFGVIGFAMRRGQHGFASSQAVVPTAFDLVVAFDHAARARQELGLGGAA
ncbi:general stress protein, partial [Microbacterium sp. KNMS]